MLWSIILGRRKWHHIPLVFDQPHLDYISLICRSWAEFQAPRSSARNMVSANNDMSCVESSCCWQRGGATFLFG